MRVVFGLANTCARFSCGDPARDQDSTRFPSSLFFCRDRRGVEGDRPVVTGHTRADRSPLRAMSTPTTRGLLVLGDLEGQCGGEARSAAATGGVDAGDALGVLVGVDGVQVAKQCVAGAEAATVDATEALHHSLRIATYGRSS